MIDIQTTDWKSFVDQIKQCRKIISSSLHGLIIAEAYGIPTEWRDWGGGVIGDGWKFFDYYSATDRDVKGLGKMPELKKEDLKLIQDGLIKAIKSATINT
jgi:pyruvyltransferase